jgi:hypothetical protein
MATKFDPNAPHQQFFGPVQGAPQAARYLQNGVYFDHRQVEVKAQAGNSEPIQPSQEASTKIEPTPLVQETPTEIEPVAALQAPEVTPKRKYRKRSV